MSALLDAALKYATQGRSVFPLKWAVDGGCSCGEKDCDSPAKHPNTPNGLTDATTDAEVIRQWWSEHPQANIGLVMGGGLLAIDIDPRHGGDESIADLGDLPDTVTALTGGGGRHLIYHIKEDCGNRIGILPGVDIKCKGGYIVAPPSLHVSGKRYQWEVDHAPGETMKPALLPDVFKGLMQNGQRPPVDVGEVLAGVPEGQRDNELFRAACSLRRANVPQDMAEQLVLEAAAKCAPPFPEREARAKVANAYARYAPGEETAPENPTAKTDDAPPEKMLASAPTQGIGGGGQHFQPVRADILATSEPEKTSWAWEGYAPQGGVTLYCAPPKTGKTTVAYHLAAAVSEGRPFLGKPTTKSAVLILAVEERRQDAANRARALGLGENVYLHTGPLRADSVPTIAAFVMQKKIGLIIIDTLPRFWVLENENDASAVNIAMAGIMALARDTNAALLLLYHLRKSPGGIDGEEIRGSGDIFSQVDIALIMRRRRDQSNQRTIKSFSRYDATPEEIIVALEDDEYVSLGDSGAVKEMELDKVLMEALSEVDRTPEQIKEDADLKLAVRTLRRHYARLFEANRCGREGTGQRALPYTYKMLATDERPASSETPSTDTNKLAATTDSLVVTGWPAKSGQDSDSPDACLTCGAEATYYAPNGKPFCDEHRLNRSWDTEQEVS